MKAVFQSLIIPFVLLFYLLSCSATLKNTDDSPGDESIGISDNDDSTIGDDLSLSDENSSENLESSDASNLADSSLSAGQSNASAQNVLAFSGSLSLDGIISRNDTANIISRTDVISAGITVSSAYKGFNNFKFSSSAETYVFKIVLTLNNLDEGEVNSYTTYTTSSGIFSASADIDSLGDNTIAILAVYFPQESTTGEIEWILLDYVVEQDELALVNISDELIEANSTVDYGTISNSTNENGQDILQTSGIIIDDELEFMANNGPNWLSNTDIRIHHTVFADETFEYNMSTFALDLDENLFGVFGESWLTIAESDTIAGKAILTAAPPTSASGTYKAKVWVKDPSDNINQTNRKFHVAKKWDFDSSTQCVPEIASDPTTQFKNNASSYMRINKYYTGMLLAWSSNFGNQGKYQTVALGVNKYCSLMTDGIIKLKADATYDYELMYLDTYQNQAQDKNHVLAVSKITFDFGIKGLHWAIYDFDSISNGQAEILVENSYMLEEGDSLWNPNGGSNINGEGIFCWPETNDGLTSNKYLTYNLRQPEFYSSTRTFDFDDTPTPLKVNCTKLLSDQYAFVGGASDNITIFSLSAEDGTLQVDSQTQIDPSGNHNSGITMSSVYDGNHLAINYFIQNDAEQHLYGFTINNSGDIVADRVNLFQDSGILIGQNNVDPIFSSGSSNGLMATSFAIGSEDIGMLYLMMSLTDNYSYEPVGFQLFYNPEASNITSYYPAPLILASGEIVFFYQYQAGSSIGKLFIIPTSD
ncbi:MAG: hypothetical protein ABIA04_00670 [Pseudomonadota bacterium]